MNQIVWVIAYLCDGMLTDLKVVDSLEKAKERFNEYIREFSDDYLADLRDEGFFSNEEGLMYFCDKDDRHQPEIRVESKAVE